MPTKYTANYYVERARGGAGLVVLESMAVHPKGQMGPGFIKSFDREIISPMQDIARRIHECGGKVFSQLQHCGSTVVYKGPQLLYAPSEMVEPGKPYLAKEIEIDEIHDVVKHFGICAAIQQEANIDGVELKVGHDGLLRAFASPYSNRREDEYGGSFENRMRILYEIVAEIRNRVGKYFPIGARVSLDEFTPWGYSLDYGVKVARALEDAGVDYISTDVGTQGNVYMQVPPTVIPLGYAIYTTAAVKKALKIPVFAFGRINDPVLAEQILVDGNADFIGMCRQLICDPETPNKAKEGCIDDIRHCIACMDGCMFQTIQQNHAHCIQNPATGREEKWGIGKMKPAKVKKKVMVIGGGVAGMKAAEILAKRGHEALLYEKSNILGGQLNLAEKLPYRSEIEEVTRYLKLQIDKLHVPVFMNTEVHEELVDQVDPDVVIVATGSIPYMPVISGMQDTDINIMTVHEALQHPETIGNNVVVLDKNGHWKAAGICEYALALGAKVHCITPFNQMGCDLEAGTCEMLYQRAYEKGIEIIIFHDLKEVTKNAVFAKHNYKTPDIVIENVDTLIIADHAVADNKLYKSLKKRRDNVYAVGDCLIPRLVEQAIYDSEELCREL
jgi:2,4-dienoyl-CoA reductase-like NADH-dependent reductase (Old Yellow Enzyme family)/thioredoxin reductase